MKKRIFALAVAAVMGAACMPSVAALAQEQSSSENGGYYYGQLTPDAKKFYRSMEKMLQNGELKNGSAAHDLVADGTVSAANCEGYAEGNSKMLTDMGAARDAFDADYPELFYVDFSQISLRVTLDEKGNYGATLGVGASDEYFADGITAADVGEKISSLDGEIRAIAASADSLTTPADKVAAVHDALTAKITYKLESQASAGNADYVRSAYGALVRGEGLCEAYAKSFKIVMDEIGIPCITVQGTYSDENSGGAQLHMWNYVNLDGGWFGVDVTMDDPIGGSPTREFLLKGQMKFGRTHSPDGVLSQADYEFTYPELSPSEYGGIVYADENFIVDISAITDHDGYETRQATVSYKGMGYAKAAEGGEYLVADYGGGWGYLYPELYGGALQDNDGFLSLPFYSSYTSVRFGVTEKPWTNDLSAQVVPDEEVKIKSRLSELDFTSVYYRPPYVESLTPANNTTITPGKTVDVTVIYTEKLKAVEGEEFSVTFYADNAVATNSTTLTDAKWDGDRTITFRFTPSSYYAGDTCNYYITVNGLAGEESGKAPNSFGYFAKNRIFMNCPLIDGLKVYSKPALLAGGDLSTEGWKYKDGSDVSADVPFRLALVASKPQGEEQEALEGAIADTGTQPLACSTYKLNLSLCNGEVAALKDGQKMKVMLPYPDGYDPSSKGVSFKAYHFTTDDKGNTVAEEIDVFANEYGLVIFCDSFSPFAVAAVKAEEGGAKKIFIRAERGGRVSEELVTLEKDAKTIEVTPDSGMVVDSVTVNGEEIGVENGKITLDPQTMKDGDTVIVRFVAESVKTAEIAAGKSVVSFTCAETAIGDPGENPGENPGKNPDENSGDSSAPVKIAVVATICALVAVGAIVVCTILLKKKKSK